MNGFEPLEQKKNCYVGARLIRYALGILIILPCTLVWLQPKIHVQDVHYLGNES